ncbi:hypothetical protein [Leptospira bouyouniensis]|uniref:hypothetical protein n=1 Tax=Leptospira bouyouniensis TaxID=2484911 RepID=UPI0010915304|nr:hypothetical protein [Leptospira bouyouniensis]TGM88699.1 hypothetical protein EHQ99_00025 [Leptospira bouyouniensis]
MKKLLMATLSFLSIFGCKTNSLLSNYNTPGNLKANYHLECIDLSNLKNYHTPADVYPAIKKCIESDNLQFASQLFAFAGVYGKFDMKRVKDRSAHQAIAVLRINNFSNIDSEKSKAFQNYIQNYMNQGSPELESICTQIKKIGKPNYIPMYMINHGISAFNNNNNTPLFENFDSEVSWSEVLDNYLHCSVN